MWLCVEGVLLRNNFSCAFFLVYGAHSREEKSHVWEELSYIAGLCQVPYYFMGDFNEIVNAEKRKGTVSLPLSAEEFKIWIQDMYLVDLPLTDRKFTWFRGRSCSHIDRAMVSIEWLEEFPETWLRGGQAALGACFLSMVKEEWRSLGEMQFTDKLKALTGPLGRWHKANFSGMDQKILKLEEEIKKVDDLVSNGVYDGTFEARRKALVTCWGSPLLGFRDGLVERIDEEESMTLEDEIGAKFTAAVMGFFQTSRLPTGSNITWVALAPKFFGAKEIKDLRPISMVGYVYKVVSKVLVRRMRAVMPGLIVETQSAFVKCRKIHDGALIACETVHWLKRRKKEASIIKLDFRKAYDRVRWSFVDIVLQKMGFGHRWRAWVMECVTTVSMSVLINGSPSKPVKMQRGLRQGDPLSPFLFVLVVDVLHRMVGEVVRNGRISPLVVGRDRVELSHLQFADDTILFCPLEEETMKNYKWLLRWFELMSGLSINFEKSSLIPINCEEQWIQRMCRLWGCKEDTLPVKYLGVPLGANPRLVKTWKPIIDKVEEKLSLWKAKVLSKAGKLVLIKSVLNSLPVYYLSLYKMPQIVAKKLISLQRRFLWSKEDGRNGMALVRWEVVQAPKKLGGLGIGDVMIRNTALLFKWWWRFAKEECLLWKRVVCSYNDLRPNELLSTQVLPSRGGPWKDICHLQIKEQHIRDKMITGRAMELGDGRRNQFWEDIWLQSGSLKDRFSRLLSVSNQCGSAVGDCGFWDALEWVLQEGMLPEDVTSYSFTKSIWRGLVQPRVELFVWFVLVGRVNTKERLSRFEIINQDDKSCVLCSKNVEQVHHLFLGCDFAWQAKPIKSKAWPGLTWPVSTPNRNCDGEISNTPAFGELVNAMAGTAVLVPVFREGGAPDGVEDVLQDDDDVKPATIADESNDDIARSISAGGGGASSSGTQ
ncbi:uncharacterized protein [Arachis hypogaea]|uniref:uncharacterized protein n=1 Tax=Arachis hypogaea TaxID=3818 RepID=UPI000DEDD556|nr:uncharacterized protein LOC112778177 [Arachis hypogaea]